MVKIRKMRKTDLIAHYVEHFSAFDGGLGRAHARQVVEELQRVCRQQLLETGEFSIPDIVTLRLHPRPAHAGRNPAIGERITIAARTVVRARIAKWRRPPSGSVNAGRPVRVGPRRPR